MKRMTKIGIYGMAVWLLSACGNGTPDYDATGHVDRKCRQAVRQQVDE